MSIGKEITTSGASELPAINVPASGAATPTKRRNALTSTLALLGAVGLTAAVLSPTGIALAGAPVAEESSIESGFDLVLADAQSFTLDADVSASFSAVERGGYTVYVKPKPTPTPAASTTGSTSGPPRYTGGGAPAQWMAQAGIAESDRAYVDFIVRRESGWNPNATNRSSGACGLVQVYPCGKLANAYDPVVNLRWANGYAKGRYGSWEKAYNFWQRNHWW